jgi:hypothetical protein
MPQTSTPSRMEPVISATSPPTTRYPTMRGTTTPGRHPP